MSIFLRTSVDAALYTLQATQKSLTETQARVTTGLRVQKANDNASYWSIATTTRSDVKSLSAIQDALGLAGATMDVAYTGVSSSVDIVTKIKAKLVAATEEGVDKTKINDELEQLKGELRSTGEAASFNGENWIVLDTGDNPLQPQKIPSSVIRGEDGTLKIGKMTYNIDDPANGPLSSKDARYLIDDRADGTGGYGVLTSDKFAIEAGVGQNYVLLKSRNGDTTGQVEISLSATTTKDEVADMITVVDKMLGQMTEVGSAFGSLQKRIQLQDEFAANLSDSLTRGVSRLVDADMEEESTKLQALQTQEQLGLQALSIANASYDTIRQLFQNF